MKSYISLLFSVLFVAFAVLSCNQVETEVLVTDVSINQSSAEIVIGETLQLNATVTPSNASQAEVNWASSAPSVAKVSNQGLVTALAEGSAVISATVGGKTGVCTVTVKSNITPSETVGVDHISAISAVLMGKANLGSSTAADLKIGFQYSKSAGIMPSNSTTVEGKDADAFYNYSTGVTGLDPATKYYYRSFVLQKGQYTYGETKEFTTKAMSELLETLDATDVKATSACLNGKVYLTEVGYVHKSISYGFLLGLSEGNLNTDYKCTENKDNSITAVLSNLSHQTQYWYKAYVKLDNQTFYGEVKTFTTAGVLVESISLDITEYTFNAIGNTLTLKATVLPADATNKSIEWSSDKESVATVDQTGKVTSVSKGTATIKATAKDGSGVFASCVVIVKNPCPSGAVDLGLSVYWATSNIYYSSLAGSPENYGSYYAWGETVTKNNYSWETYKFGTSSSGPFSKYNNNSSYGPVDNKTVLDPEDDIAHVLLKGNWRIPTEAEWKELIDNCTWTWTSVNGRSGLRLYSKINGNSIFLPAGGIKGSNLGVVGSHGRYWSSSITTGGPDARCVNFYYGEIITYSDDRCYGRTIRPISE